MYFVSKTQLKSIKHVFVTNFGQPPGQFLVLDIEVIKWICIQNHTYNVIDQVRFDHD